MSMLVLIVGGLDWQKIIIVFIRVLVVYGDGFVETIHQSCLNHLRGKATHSILKVSGDDLPYDYC